MRKAELKKILKQVPVDYYQDSTKNNFLQNYWHRQKMANFKKIIGKNKFKKVLDLGSASGYMTNEISRVLPTAKIWGVDAYKEAIAFGRKKYPHIKFKIGDAHKLPFSAGSFDLVVCYETIEHVVSPPKMLKEIQRVLAKNGKAIVAMDSGSPLFRVIWFVWEKTKGRVWQRAHLHPFKHKELEELIKESGFKIVKKKFSHFGMEVIFFLSH